MALEKLKFLVETRPGEFTDEIEVRFNPNQLTIQKSTNWRLVPTGERDSPASQFTYGDPATLSMELFFDTYEAGTDVQEDTKKIFHLTTVEQHGELHRPPLCRIKWGTHTHNTFKDFDWILQKLNQRFTLFLDNGTAVRATLSCTFRQWRSDETEAKLLNKQSADVVKSRTVKQGDTLSSIAGEEYSDPAIWRAIAKANGIDNPRALEAGRVLVIPALR
jgi:nucleoid-associated protein YgaU